MALAIDLFCGLGGWTEGLLAEGYTVVCPGETAERIAGLESMHDETLTRAEQAEATTAALRKALAAFVTLVDREDGYELREASWDTQQKASEALSVARALLSAPTGDGQ